MRYFILLIIPILLLSWMPGCASVKTANLAATTLPVYEFTTWLCRGTELTVTRVINENVSCLHDYTLRADQMRAIQGADAVIISGAGLEDFMEDALAGAKQIIDASSGLNLLDGKSHDHDHDHSSHIHAEDPHIWLSPSNAMIMAHNICHGLEALYPEHKALFEENLNNLQTELESLLAYGKESLTDLSCRELVTFHDGFSYLAESFDLKILAAVEEESGSEASAKQLIHLIELVNAHALPAVFTEINGSVSAANILAEETGVTVYALDMAITGDSYFEAMRRNIEIIQEAMQ